MSKIMLTDYWRCEKLLLNMGDYITELLIKKFGYDVEYYSAARRKDRLGEYGRCTLIIGTLFDRIWFKRIKVHKHIWGCGYWGDEKFLLENYKDCTVHLVRGPVTRDRLGLPPDTPTGDPALLMSHFFPMQRTESGRSVYIAHFNSRDNLSAETLALLGVDAFVDIACTKGTFWDRVKAIVDAEFVLASSLHAAIVAQSYKRPWALVIPPGAKHNKPLKWEDWFASLGLELKICRDLREGERWWTTHGARGVTPCIEGILRSFPHLA